MPSILGIDPGNNGGLVVMNHRGGEWHLDKCFKLEHGEAATIKFLTELAWEFDDTAAYLEKVGGWGVARSFNFGKYYGFVRGAMMMRGIPIVDVLPQTWMSAMGVTGKSQTKEKRQSMRKLAAELQNDVEATNWNAAAILIAFYGIREEQRKGYENKILTR